MPDSTGIAAGSNASDFYNFRIFIFKDLWKDVGCAGYSSVTRIASFLEENAAEAIAVGVVGVIMEFVVDPKEDHDETCHPYGEACNIDEGIPLVSSDVPECDLDVIFKHGSLCLCVSVRLA